MKIEMFRDKHWDELHRRDNQSYVEEIRRARKEGLPASSISPAKAFHSKWAGDWEKDNWDRADNHLMGLFLDRDGIAFEGKLDRRSHLVESLKTGERYAGRDIRRLSNNEYRKFLANRKRDDRHRRNLQTRDAHLGGAYLVSADSVKSVGDPRWELNPPSSANGTMTALQMMRIRTNNRLSGVRLPTRRVA